MGHMLYRFLLLVLGLAALSAPMAASAQAPNGSTQSRPLCAGGESYAKTANGCTMIIGPYPSMSENDRAQVTYAYKDTHGNAIDGLAMGPGTLIDRNYEGTAVDYIREGAIFMAGALGQGRIARVYSGGNAEYFVWNGVEYIVYGDMEESNSGTRRIRGLGLRTGSAPSLQGREYFLWRHAFVRGGI
jgi:hypothetical protein